MRQPPDSSHWPLQSSSTRLQISGDGMQPEPEPVVPVAPVVAPVEAPVAPLPVWVPAPEAAGPMWLPPPDAPAPVGPVTPLAPEGPEAAPPASSHVVASGLALQVCQSVPWKTSLHAAATRHAT